MIKMKKLICSLFIALGGLFIAATSSDAASISFTPPGTQLDGDGILDIEVFPHQVIEFEVFFDTHNITTNPPLSSGVNIYFSIALDPSELELVILPPGTIELPLVSGYGFTNGQSGFLALQNTSGTLTKFKVKVLHRVIDDGKSDVALYLNSANIGRIDDNPGQEVRKLFENKGEQTVEVQPPYSVPEPTTILGSVLALGFGATLKPKLKPSKSRKKEAEKFS